MSSPMSSADDPLRLFVDVTEKHRCSICRKEILKQFKICYGCKQELQKILDEPTNISWKAIKKIEMKRAQLKRWRLHNTIKRDYQKEYAREKLNHPFDFRERRRKKLQIYRSKYVKKIKATSCRYCKNYFTSNLIRKFCSRKCCLKYMQSQRQCFSKKQLMKIFLSCNYQCSYCFSKKQLGIDHVIPLCRGGKDTLSNLTVACMQCNRMKARRLLEEWFS